MKFVNFDDPILREAIPDYDFENDPEYDEVSLVNFMLENRAFTITAPEIGDRVRIMAIGDPADFRTVVILYNPKIVVQSDEMVKMEENIPIFNKTVKVKRPDWIKIRFQDGKGIIHTKEFTGLTARFLHRAINQLDGKNTYLEVPIVERLRASKFII